MNKSINAFACATVASMLLLACNIAGDGESSPQAATQKGGQDGNPNSYEISADPFYYTPGMICTEGIPVLCYPINKPPYDPSSEPPPYKPGPAIIAKDVEQWMEEQLASGNSEKRLIMISNMSLPETQPPGLSAFGRSDSNGEYFVEYSFNGNTITAEEYYRILEEYRQGINTGKRNLSIPGEIRLDLLDSPYGWVVLMTAEELAELSKKYDKLAIEFYIEPVNE